MCIGQQLFYRVFGCLLHQKKPLIHYVHEINGFIYFSYATLRANIICHDIKADARFGQSWVDQWM
jgi:hypothetical protein